ncbi:MAG TPA: two-component regulator propeller domain-containing protein, partial [Verrucomicrobiae bacterium]|nr:two-component regulator propeller domain-containing protein [Verrucomicrobiae bacterium]
MVSVSASTNSAVQYSSRAWQTDEGLPQNTVQTIAQTRDGYLWVGTPGGLARFDGLHFTVFDPQNTPALQNPSITALCETKDGTLWIGTAGNGLASYKDGHFTHQNAGDGPRENSIKCFLEASDSTLWVGALGGLFQYRDGTWRRFATNDGLYDDVVRSVCEWDGQLCIGTGSGLNTFKNGVISTRSLHGLEHISVRTVMRDSRGNLWMGLTEGLAFAGQKEVRLYTKKDGLPDSNVTAVYEDRNGVLWVGTYGGLCRMVDGKFLIEKDHDGGFYDQVNKIIEDSEGDLWVGTRDGLHELRAKHFVTYTRQQGLAHNNVMSVLEGRDGAIWVGTWGGGLVRMKNGKITSYNKENFQVSGMGTDQVLSIFEDGDGSIFAGADYEGGTFRLSGEKFARFWTREKSLSNRVVRVIYRDRKDNLWFGCNPGLVLEASNQKFLDQDDIRCVAEDHDGTLWVGTDRGLYSRADGIFKQFPLTGECLNRPVLALHEDQQQKLWISVGDCGLACIAHGRCSLCTCKQGLWSANIFEILEDDHDWLWMSCPKGIFRVSKSNLSDLEQGSATAVTSIAYGKSDGMESIQCSGVSKPAAWRGHDGRLWFATAKGLVVTDPNVDLGLNEKAPPVKIEQVLVDKKPLAMTNGSPVKIGAGRGELEIHYTALSFQFPEKNHFRYRLAGVDPEWVEAGSRRVAFYNNIRPGSYNFQVTACNNDGTWSEKPAQLGLTLLPHFWQLRSFTALAGLGMAGVLAFFVRYGTQKKLERQVAGLEQQNAIEKERTRIAQDMHDDLGARLTEILLLNELARKNEKKCDELNSYLSKQSHVVRDVAESLDTIVWAVNPVNDSLDRLANYLCEQVERLISVSLIRCRFDVPDELPRYFVSSEI